MPLNFSPRCLKVIDTFRKTERRSTSVMRMSFVWGGITERFTVITSSGSRGCSTHKDFFQMKNEYPEDGRVYADSSEVSVGATRDGRKKEVWEYTGKGRSNCGGSRWRSMQS